MKDFLRSQKGYTGVDLAVAIVILSIFTLLISTIFVNIYMQYTEASRSAAATSYATAIAENIDKIYYQDVTQGSSAISTAIQNANLPNGYNAEVNVSSAIDAGKDLVKNIEIMVTYKVGSNTKNITIKRLKAKEILIIPNKPKIVSGMVPVKYVITDYASQTGYWQITTEKDTTWYNYENKNWACAMALNGLTIEGEEIITESNKELMAGRRVTNASVTFSWIPRYAYNSSSGDIKFIYSTTDKTVDNKGELADKGSQYVINNSFEANSGFWISQTETNSSETGDFGSAMINPMTSEQRTAVTNLSNSKYGLGSSIWTNLTNARLVVTLN